MYTSALAHHTCAAFLKSMLVQHTLGYVHWEDKGGGMVSVGKWHKVEHLQVAQHLVDGLALGGHIGGAGVQHMHQQVSLHHLLQGGLQQWPTFDFALYNDNFDG